MRHRDWLHRVAHDLRNPLAPLQTAVYLLRSADVADDERVQLLELIDRQSILLAAMIDELADCLRAEDGRLLGRRVEVDLATLALLAVARADAAPVQCEPAGVHLRLLGDDSRLLQLLRILRELRLSQHEQRPAPLIIERDGRRALLHRSLDCSADLLAHPARLLDSPLPAPLADGLGLQLPLAAAVVREHDGQLRAEPRDGRLAVIAELPLLA